MASRSSVAGAFALLLLPHALRAQVLRGNVVDGGAAGPLAGVVVLLIDSAGNTVTRSLTDERGEYRLSAARSGTYRVRALRIGFRPRTSDPIVLGRGQVVAYPPLLTGIPISLDTVHVQAQNACLVRSDSAATTFAVWEQIRTALAAAQLTAMIGNLSATIVTYRQSLDSDGRRVLEQSSTIGSGIRAQPWTSVPAHRLRQTGYAVNEEDGSTTYFAPTWMSWSRTLSPRTIAFASCRAPGGWVLPSSQRASGGASQRFRGRSGSTAPLQNFGASNSAM